MSVHSGHRQRLKQRFLENGLDEFTDIQALELLLFFSVPQKDTNPIAHALLARFGTLAQVLDAPVEELQKVEGIGEHSAILLHMMTEMSRKYQVDRSAQEKVLPTLESCAAYLVPRFFGRKLETVFLLCLDAKCKVLSCKEVGEGGINSAGVPVRKIVETALAAGASSVVLAHNHPSGVAIPSAEDIQTTKRLAVALEAVDVHLADHVIVADEDYVSLAMSGQSFRDCLVI